MDAVDDSYIWQRRIAHGVRLQKGRIPFPDSVEVGLEFNAALERKDKLDLSKLTNGVILDIFRFASTVTKSEKQFLFEILEFNFDLGVDLDNVKQCFMYAMWVYAKIKQLNKQIKLNSSILDKVFPLPDPNTVLKMTGVYKPLWNKTADTSVLTSSSSRACLPSDGGNASSAEKNQSRKLTTDTYPFCAQLGVTLAVGLNQEPKKKLGTSKLTVGVMRDLLLFSKVLCGSHCHIVCDLIKQNFGFEQEMHLLRSGIKQIERKSNFISVEERAALRKEPFQIQFRKNPKGLVRRRKNREVHGLLRHWEDASRRGLRRRSDNAEDTRPDPDLSYTCPIDCETEMCSETENVNIDSLEETSETNSLTVVQQNEEPEQLKMDGHKSRLTAEQPDDTSPVPNSGPSSEEVNRETYKQKLWRRRAARSQQILMKGQVKDMFVQCQMVGLDFNVCSSSKQKLDLQLLTNWVLWEVYQFANEMMKSICKFLFDILISNFSLTLQGDLQERNFIFYMIIKVRSLQNHLDRQKSEFLEKPFQFPEVSSTIDISSNFQAQQEIETEQQNPAPDVEKYPFCKKLGLDLWSSVERPQNQKLDLTALTIGAVFEMFGFVRELCGSISDTVNDVLEQNFDLDLGRHTEAAWVIQRWYVMQKSLIERENGTQRTLAWLNTIVPLNSSQTNPQSDVQHRTPAVQPDEPVSSYQTCREIGLDLDLRFKTEAKPKLDLQVLTRRVLLEIHRYVQQNSSRYVPALYEILEYNFDLSSQNHQKVELAWSIASQVITMAGKIARKGDYLNKVFELPFEFSEASRNICKEEPEEVFSLLNHTDDDILFIQELKPVDMEVEID